MKENFAALWESGSILCIYEGRVKSKSQRNPYKIRNPEKTDHNEVDLPLLIILRKSGAKHIPQLPVEKPITLLINCLTPTKRKKKLLVIDNGFPTVQLLEHVKQMLKTKVVATQRGITAHSLARHQTFLKQKQTKNFSRGFSKSLQHDFLTITYWNDNNAVCFMDNDTDLSCDTWEIIAVKNRNGEKTAVHISKAASQYRSVYGWVDSCNHKLSYYNTECWLYALANGHTIWSNSNLRVNEIDPFDFCFETIRLWYSDFMKNNGKSEILHYPLRQPRKRRNVSNVLLSPRIGKASRIFLSSHHHQEREREFNSSNKAGKL